MTIEQKRMAIAEVYPYKKWSDKVDNMSDNQVIGVYNSFLKSGKLGPKTATSQEFKTELRARKLEEWEKIKNGSPTQETIYGIFKQFDVHLCKGCGILVDEGETYCESCQDIIEAFGSMEAAMTEGLKDENIY